MYGFFRIFASNTVNALQQSLKNLYPRASEGFFMVSIFLRRKKLLKSVAFFEKTV